MSKLRKVNIEDKRVHSSTWRLNCSRQDSPRSNKSRAGGYAGNYAMRHGECCWNGRVVRWFDEA